MKDKIVVEIITHLDSKFIKNENIIPKSITTSWYLIGLFDTKNKSDFGMQLFRMECFPKSLTHYSPVLRFIWKPAI